MRIVFRVEFLRAAFFTNEEQRCALASVVFDRAVSALNPAVAAIAVGKRRRISVEKSLGVRERDGDIVRILAPILPSEDAAGRCRANWMRLIRPKVNQVRPMTEPLIENAGGKVAIQPEFHINVRVEWAVRFSQKPALPIGIFFLYERRMFAVIELRNAPPAWLIHIPLLRDPDDLPDPARLDDVANSQRVGLASVLRAHLYNLLGCLHSSARCLRLC